MGGKEAEVDGIGGTPGEEPGVGGTPGGGGTLGGEGDQGGGVVAHKGYYVKADGDDGHTGTKDQPLATVGAALTKLATDYATAGDSWPDKGNTNEGRGAIVILGTVSDAGITIDETASNLYPPIVLYGGISGNAGTLTLTTGTLLTVNKNARVSLRYITLQGVSGNTASLSMVNNGGTLILETGACITGNTTSKGGGVYVAGGTFTMNDGTITGNTSTYDGGGYGGGGGGGGVYVASGIFTMTGGIISNNNAIRGGGVNVAGGTFMMNDGTISGNVTTASGSYEGGGGGVYVKSAIFTMTGGIISGNKANNNGHGGGVFLYSGSSTFNKTGGIIYGTDASPSELANIAQKGAVVRIGAQGYSDPLRELTAGPTVNLSYINSSASF